MNIPTTLPFFDSVQKQATRRDGSSVLIYSPRTQLPPFQIKRTHSADDWVEDIVLIDCDDTEINIEEYFKKSSELITETVGTHYFNGPGVFQNMDTLTQSLTEITSAIKTTTGSGDAGIKNATPFTVTSGERLYIKIDLTLNSGVAPTIYLANQVVPQTPTSNSVLLVSGVNKIILTSTATNTAMVSFLSDTADQTNYEATVSLTRTNRPEVFELTSVDYIQYSGDVLVHDNLISEFKNASGATGFDTWTSSGTIISSAISLLGGGYAYSNIFTVTAGEKITIFIPSYVLTSGVNPEVRLYEWSGGAIGSAASGTGTTTGSGDITVTVTVNAGVNGDVVLRWYGSDITNHSAGNVIVNRALNTGSLVESQLKNYLPKGTYYIKINDGTNEWYSEWFNIQDVYDNLISSWNEASDTYETFITDGSKITSAIETGSNGAALSSSSFSVANNEKIIVLFFLTLNSGTAPTIRLAEESTVISNNEVATEGINKITLTPTKSASTVNLAIRNTANVNFYTSEIWVMRQYSPEFVKLKFSDSNDLHGKRSDDQTILYQESFEQECWLNTRLNTPGSNRVDVGQEKDGVYVPEKIVTQYKYRIIDYINRSLFQGLLKLPQHDDITITDEVGNEYTPDTGNVQVSAEWSVFDIGNVTIEFNDGSFVWTENADDIT